MAVGGPRSKVTPHLVKRASRSRGRLSVVVAVGERLAGRMWDALDPVPELGSPRRCSRPDQVGLDVHVTKDPPQLGPGDADIVGQLVRQSLVGADGLGIVGVPDPCGQRNLPHPVAMADTPVPRPRGIAQPDAVDTETPAPDGDVRLVPLPTYRAIFADGTPSAASRMTCARPTSRCGAVDARTRRSSSTPRSGHPARLVPPCTPSSPPSSR